MSKQALIVPFNISRQLRTVEAGKFIVVPIAKMESDYLMLVNMLDVYFVTAQGEQDVVVRLKAGTKEISRTGKLKTLKAKPYDRPVPAAESRTHTLPGSPYSELTSSSGEGFPDNFGNLFATQYLVEGNEMLNFELINQSIIYRHSVYLWANGYLKKAES